MQINKLISSVNGDPFRSTTKKAKSENLPSNSGDLFYFSPSSLSFSPSPVSTNGGDDPGATEIDLYLDNLAYQYQYCEMTDSDLMSRLAMQLRPEISLANWKSRPNSNHEDGENTSDDMAISMEMSADMDDLMSLEPSQIPPDVKNDSLRYERCLSYLQEATEQEGNSGLTSRVAMQLRSETSLMTSVLPLQPLNENQLLHHAAEKQAMPAPKGLASHLNDGISSVIPVKHKRSPKMPGCSREEQPSGLDKEFLTRDEVDAELLEMWSMDKEAAEAVATEICLRLALKILMDTDRNDRCLSYLQEATEQEGNSDLTSRLAMQLRPESSLTSVLPLQPLNENQLLHHAAERQAVPAPKTLASQLHDGISTVIPGPTTGSIVILLIILCISEAHATLSSDPSAPSKILRQVCTFPSWRDGLNNTTMDVISYLVLLVGYLVNWFIVVHYEVTKRGQSWMYLSCLFLSCIPLVIISFDDDHKHWDKIKILTGIVASTFTIALDVARYANFGHHWAASCFAIGLMAGGAAFFVLEMRAAYIAQFADVGTNIVTTAILIICLLWKEDWEYTTLEVFAAFIAAVCLVPNVTTCELPIAVLTGVAFIARCLYGALLCYCLGTTGRATSSWEPAWEDMKTWPMNIICIVYCCKVTIGDYFCVQVIGLGIKDLWEQKILPGIKYARKKLIRGFKYLWSKLCEFVTSICEWMKQGREETQLQWREIELTPFRVRMDP